MPVQSHAWQLEVAATLWAQGNHAHVCVYIGSCAPSRLPWPCGPPMALGRTGPEILCSAVVLQQPDLLLSCNPQGEAFPWGPHVMGSSSEPHYTHKGSGLGGNWLYSHRKVLVVPQYTCATGRTQQSLCISNSICSFVLVNGRLRMKVSLHIPECWLDTPRQCHTRICPSQKL